jgi:hypothetical protein
MDSVADLKHLEATHQVLRDHEIYPTVRLELTFEVQRGRRSNARVEISKLSFLYIKEEA